MLIVAITGPSGSGKSTLIRSLGREFPTLPERYMELNVHAIDNRTVLSKWAYVASWFDSVLREAENRQPILITDRSPYDVCAYVTAESDCVFRAVHQSMRDLRELFGHDVRTVLLTASLDELTRRIEARITREPERARYHEQDTEYCRQVYAFYQSKINSWDAVVDATSLDEVGTHQHVREVIGRLIT